MSPSLRHRSTLVGGALLVLVLVAAAAVVGVRWWQDRPGSELERAMGFAPAETARYSWTDWRAVRAELGADLDADSSSDEVADMLLDGYDADLTSESAMGESVDVLRQTFGFSPATVDWELLAQSTTGSVLVLGVPDDFDLDALGDTLATLGYERPDSGADSGAVWRGTADLVARIAARAGGSLSPQFTNFALDADEHLLMASDTGPYLRDAATDLESRLDDEGVRDVTRAVGDPLAAAVYSGDFACRSLAMAQADESDQDIADQLVAATGGVDPLTGFAMAAEPDGTVDVALGFESDDQARANADSRAELAAGPAPGQGGSFGDRFDLGPVTADGRVVTMSLEPVDDAPVLSDLATGPVLFATC